MTQSGIMLAEPPTQTEQVFMWIEFRLLLINIDVGRSCCLIPVCSGHRYNQTDSIRLPPFNKTQQPCPIYFLLFFSLIYLNSFVFCSSFIPTFFSPVMVRWRQGAVGQPSASSAWICVCRCTVLSLRYCCMTAKHYLIVQHPRRHCLGGKNLEHPSISFFHTSLPVALYGGSTPKDRRSLKVFWWESKLIKGLPGRILAFSW